MSKKDRANIDYKPFIYILGLLVNGDVTYKATLEDVKRISKKPETHRVLSCLVSNAVTYSKAVRELVTLGGTEAVAPLYRAVYEILLDVKQIVEDGDPEENSLKFLTNSAFEIKDSHEDLNTEEFYFEHLEKADALLKRIKEKYPHIYFQIESQRNKRIFNWSSKSRKQVEKDLFGSTTSLSPYKMMSWEAHSVTSPLLNYKFIDEEDITRIEFGSDDPFLTHGGPLCFLVTCILIEIFGAYESAFGHNPWCQEEISDIRATVSKIRHKACFYHKEKST
ncbi:hypothetical protein C8255_05410 [filamentous cyanobacterium CCP3]|nr:hypothetical protein C8255_05410 [filamentous cyanobacterium CCP3]